MVKRTASGGTAHVTPRPRKKQAVTKTNSGKIKTLIRKNAVNSPLLSLPSEVRENILVNLIGDNLIHVKHFSHNALAEVKDVSWYDLHRADPKFAKEGAFRHAICVATKSEQGVYDAIVAGNAMVPEDEDPNYFIASCRKRHEGCKMTQAGSKKILPEEHGSLRLDLKVLGACRQLYEEANHLLWTTNTFSFDDANSLNRFLASLNPAQKRNMSGIHISAKLDHWESSRWGDQAWSIPLKMSYINMLRGVQHLHLCFQQCYASVPHLPQTSAQSYGLCKQGLDDQVKPFLRLRALNTKNITIVLSDNISRFLDEHDQTLFRWDNTAKNRYAEDIRVQLTAPNGAELVRSDAELANAANEIDLMKKWEQNVSIAETRVKAVSDLLEDAAERAEEYETKAERYAAKAAEHTGKIKKAAILQARATSSTAAAEAARREVERLRRRATILQDEVVQAVAKYERAKARVEARKAKNQVQTSNATPETNEQNSTDNGNNESYDREMDLKGLVEDEGEARDMSFSLEEDLNDGEEAGQDEEGEWHQHRQKWKD